MSNVKVKYVGDDEIYSGWDGDQILNLTQGEEGTVSEAKAKQLADDRPYDFEIGGKPPEKRPSRKREPEPSGNGDAPLSIERLMKLGRPKLDELADELGISGAAAMENKRDVANAILAAVDEQETH